MLLLALSLSPAPGSKPKPKWGCGGETDPGDCRALLALANATVVLACRNLSRCERAQSLIAEASAWRASALASTLPLALDLESLQSVAAFAAALEAELQRRVAADEPARAPSLDLLVNNAGVAAQFPLRLTEDGVESTFQANETGRAEPPAPVPTPIPNGSRQANYLGHFALTTRLLPLLTRTAAGRSGGRGWRTAPFFQDPSRTFPGTVL